MRLSSVHWRAIAVVLGIGILGGLLLIPVNTYAATVARGIPLLYAPVVGAWLLPVLTSMLTVRRPGAGLAAALVAGLVNVPTTSYGIRALVTMAMVGVFLELAIAITLYRRWDRWIFAVAIVVACVLYGIVTWRSLDVGSLGLPSQLAFFGLLVVSGLGALVLAAVAARVLAQTPIVSGRSASRPGEPLVTDGGWRYDGKSATKPETTP
ncbi:ECF transporter S component [Lysobacter korlensis]|uniref:ECF transporter S component n=1 Tax=Lysobacter korlensis TaxID=553636 RepID=A0ABV6RVW7_9GAMM